MELKRSVLREKIMIILYQIDIAISQKINYDVDKIIKANVEVDNEFVKQIVYGVVTYKDEIDNKANKYMKDWTIDRLGLTDAAIIEIAIYEIKYTETPNIVCINEAIELSKKYSDDKVSKMINGILDKVYKDFDND